jgi:hypothetical protein
MTATSTDVITVVTVARTEVKAGRNGIFLVYDLTFEYEDGRKPIETTIKDDVNLMVGVLEELGVSDRAATLILQRGGVVVRVPA